MHISLSNPTSEIYGHARVGVSGYWHKYTHANIVYNMENLESLILNNRRSGKLWSGHATTISQSYQDRVDLYVYIGRKIVRDILLSEKIAK